jgi:predicted dienelactone hydrolase/ABC-type amino acid transport substrate-binding protein
MKRALLWLCPIIKFRLFRKKKISDSAQKQQVISKIIRVIHKMRLDKQNLKEIDVSQSNRKKLTIICHKKTLKRLYTGFLASLALISIALKPKPMLGAERISFSLPVLGEFDVSVDSLELFAKEGEIASDLQLYTSRLDRQTVTQLRQALQQQFDVNPATVYRLTNMAMGEKFLKEIGEVIYTHPNRNGLYAIRSALILAATDPEGFNAINVMRHFPTQEIQVNTKLIFSLIKETANFLSYNKTTIAAIAQSANREVASQPKIDLGQLPDLRQPGTYPIKKKTITFEIEEIRQTLMGFANSYNLDADIYLPKDLSQPTPLIVISHGFTSERSDFVALAEHFASYGYIVLVPEHVGSNREYKEAFLRGELSVDVSPSEFYSRPRDITYLLNAIENHSEFQGLIDWQQVGILGHSFGGTTALLTSGATLNQERIRQVCQQNRPTLNVSMLLQCRASHLPPAEYNLRDPRIKAVVAVNPVTSSVLGPEGLKEITIPTMIWGGSKDLTAPFIEEQAHPFLWLTTQNKYLGVVEGGTHSLDLGKSYLQALSVAFFDVYLRGQKNYQSYLTNAYSQTISTKELPLHLIKSLTPEELEQAYGNTPPTPPIPESLVAISPSEGENTLAEIKKTRTLKVGMRTDAAPLGYIDSKQDLWTGFCADFADSLGNYLTQKLNITSGIEVIKLPSNLENRFELVEQDTVHLECGPNSISKDREDISFSNPFFVSGTRLLVTNGNVAQVNLTKGLEGVKIGVLQNTTTAEFIEETYPEAEIVYFQGQTGRSEGIKAVTHDSIDTFVSDDLLLRGEIEQQNLPPNNYQLVPKEPLTCDFYGLILPEGDRQWHNTVNAFIARQAQQLQNKWLGEYFPQAVSDLDYCFHKQKN